MQRLAVGWLVLQSTGSPFAVATVYAFNFMPNLFLGPIVGIVLDRVNRKHLLMGVHALGALTCLTLAIIVLTDRDETWLVLLLAGVFGVSVSFNIPTIPTLVFDIVDTRDALNANALRSMGQRTMGIMGAASGGVLIGVVGVGGTILVAGVLLTLAMANTALMDYQRRTVIAGTGSVIHQIWEGFRYFGSNGGIASLLVAAMVAEAFGFGALSLLPFFADEDFLDVGSKGLGVMNAAVGLGGGIAGLMLAIFARQGRRGLILALAFIMYGVFIGIFSRSDIFLFSFAALLGFGFAAGTFDMTLVVLLQSNVPDQMRGRVMGAWTLAIGMGPVGALILGVLGENFGVRNALGVGSLILLGSSLSVAFLLPYVRRLP